jgi:hypothetical protein
MRVMGLSLLLHDHYDNMCWAKPIVIHVYDHIYVCKKRGTGAKSMVIYESRD